MPVLAHSGRWGCAPARSSASQRRSREASAVARVCPVGVRDRHSAAQLRVRREDGVGLGVDPRDEERGDRCDGADRFPRLDPAFEAGDVGVDDLLVAVDGEQQRHVDVDTTCREGLDRGQSRLGGRNLDHRVGPGDPGPQLERLLDRGLGVIGDIGGALEGHEAVATASSRRRRAAVGRRPADVVERDREEELSAVAAPAAARAASWSS